MRRTADLLGNSQNKIPEICRGHSGIAPILIDLIAGRLDQNRSLGPGSALKRCLQHQWVCGTDRGQSLTLGFRNVWIVRLANEVQERRKAHESGDRHNFGQMTRGQSIQSLRARDIFAEKLKHWQNDQRAYISAFLNGKRDGAGATNA